MNNISFPKMHLSFNINPVAFTIGVRSIYWYALILLSGFILGAVFVISSCEKRGLKKDSVWDIALWGLIAGIIGARIYYVLFALDEFRGHWLDVFKIWNGGMAIYGAVIAALISTSIYCKVKKISILNTFDICCGGLFIGQAVGRWGNFVNAEVWGMTTSLPWGMSINGAAPVHPLFIYESLWNVLGLILLIAFRDNKRADGQVFCFYLFWYSFARLFLEGMRNPQYILYLIPGKFGISQAVAILFMLIAIVLFILVTKHAKLTPLMTAKAADAVKSSESTGTADSETAVSADKEAKDSEQTND